MYHDIDRLSADLDSKIAAHARLLADLEGNMNELKARMDRINGLLDEIEAGNADLVKRVDSVEKAIDVLENLMIEGVDEEDASIEAWLDDAFYDSDADEE